MTEEEAADAKLPPSFTAVSPSDPGALMSEEAGGFLLKPAGGSDPGEIAWMAPDPLGGPDDLTRVA